MDVYWLTVDSDLYPNRVVTKAQGRIKRTVQLDANTMEIEERGVKLELTAVDSGHPWH